MPRAPVLTLLIAVGAIVAAPASLHFEGNEGTLEPYLAVFPIAALVAVAGAVVALRQRLVELFVLNGIVAAVDVFFWIGLLTFEGS